MPTADWRPSAAMAALEARADLYRQIRQFFDQRGLLEVETPQLARHGVTDPHIDCIEVVAHGYLQSSPEYHMKRLLAAGTGAIWQLARAYRQGEAGRRHNPEFTLLEWYRPGFSLDQLIDEVLALLALTLPQRHVERLRFREAFQAATGLDPLLASHKQLDDYARAQDASLPQLTHEQLVDWLLATQVEASFDPAAITVLMDFPGWAAALAETTSDTDGCLVARRFEVYTGGLELANGYQELRDARQQAERFAADRQRRKEAGKSQPEADVWLLDALQAGLPPVAGVALGIERWLMVMLDKQDIAEVLAFPQPIA